MGGRMTGEALALASELRRIGVELRTDGRIIFYRPQELVTPELLGQIRRHKAGLLAILRMAAPVGDQATPEPPARRTARRWRPCAAEAKERQGTRTDLRENIPAKLPERETRDAVAKIAGVGATTIRAAKYVLEHADAETLAELRTNPQTKLHHVAAQLRDDEARSKREAGRAVACNRRKRGASKSAEFLANG